MSEDVTSFDYDFYNGVVVVLADYGLPMELTARIVRIVSLSFNYFHQKINKQIRKLNPQDQLFKKNTDTYIAFDLMTVFI